MANQLKISERTKVLAKSAGVYVVVRGTFGGDDSTGRVGIFTTPDFKVQLFVHSKDILYTEDNSQKDSVMESAFYISRFAKVTQTTCSIIQGEIGLLGGCSADGCERKCESGKSCSCTGSGESCSCTACV